MHSLTEMHVYNLRQAFFSSYILEKKWDYVASGVIFFFFPFSQIEYGPFLINLLQHAPRFLEVDDPFQD